ncbi:MAG: NAD/NADP octopine/nopaline dehydrogenase family protein [Synergistaceae bacterium]|jgi:opine dehydrogenase|nr:NAD/NADP octopine/nopaline dehydrogenase family protein [Synergistaceae bacterium]
MRKIAVLGAGNGAQTMAGHLASKGFEVSLFEHPDYPQKIRDINAKGNRVVLTGAIEATGTLKTATTDMAEAVKGAEIIFLAAPTFAQGPIFEKALPCFEDGQTVVIIPGNFGSLALKKMMDKAGVKKRLFLAETDTLPYACRLIENGKSNVWGLKEYVSLATLPGSDYDAVVRNIEGVFPVGTHKLPSVLGAGLNNANMIVHCPTMLMNAGRIESEKGAFRFYTDGMSPSVCRVQEALDAERLAVANELGVKLKSTSELLKGEYKLAGATLYELLAENPAYGQHGNDAPSSMGHRYFSEDVPFLLVPLSDFGRLVGKPTPIADSIILLAGIVNGTDYRKVGWNAEKLGIAGQSKDEIVKKALA